MNILIVVPWDQEYGGVASVVGNVATQLQLKGHQVLFFHPALNNVVRKKVTKWGFPGYEGYLRAPVLAHVPLKSRLAFLTYLIPTLFQLLCILQRHKIDIVNIHYPGEECLYFALLQRVLGYKLVVSVHGADLFPYGRAKEKFPWSFRLLLHTAHLLIAPSEHMLSEVYRLFPRLRGKGVAIHNGVVLEEFPPPTTPDDDDRYILCVAQHNEKKALDVLLRAFAELRRHSSSQHELRLVGSGPLTNQLRRLASELGLNGQVQFLGEKKKPEVADLMRRCALFVLPSRAEPFGIVLLEALACQKPVVTTTVGGIPEFIQHGTSGILVSPDNSEELCRAMAMVLGDRPLAKTLAANGYETVKRHFQWSTIGTKYEVALQELLTVDESKRTDARKKV